MPTTKKPSPKKPAAPSSAAEAFAKVEPEIAALAPSEIAVINLDIPQAVSVVLGALPGLTALRPAIVHALPHHPIHLFDNLETYALAAWYAHLLALPAGSPSNPVKPLLEEAVPLRANLLGDAEALARRGLLDGDTVTEIRAGQGQIDTANDLVALSALFLASWGEIAQRTAATEAEVRRAGELGPLLLAALGVREHGASPSPREPADRRARAFTLFTRAYSSTRRAVTYLRWDEGDTDLLAPSLYKGRGGRGSSGGGSGEKESKEPEEPEVTRGAGGAPGGGKEG